MSVYNRNMFRGTRPTDQPIKQAEQMLMKKAGEKVMSDAMGGIAAAKDPVELMNAMRGDERTMKERRQELGGIVGMKDANKTPESVVTLVQPVMQMREAQAPVDQGIGQIAQRTMDTPVTKEMTQGIVQKFAPGGEVRKQTLTQPMMNAIRQGMAGGSGQAAPSSQSSMMDYYNKNLELARQIYGGDEEADRKQALANLLLGGLAPAGLQIAQGVPVAEALMPIGPLLATSGASVRELKNKREAAAKAAALDMAGDQYTASQKITEMDPGKTYIKGDGTVVQTGTPKIEYVEAFRKSDGVKVSIPRKDYNESQDLYDLSKPETIDVFRKDNPGVKIRIPLTEYNAKPGDFNLAATEYVDVFRKSDGIKVRIPQADYDVKPDLYNLSEDSKTKKAVFNQTTKQMEFATDSEIDKSGGNLVPKPDKPTSPNVYFDTQTKQNELVSTADYNKEPQRYKPKEPDTPNKLKEVFSTADNKNVFRTESAVLQDIEKGTGLFEPKRTESKAEKLTVSVARRELTGVAEEIVKGAKDPETLNRFDQLMSTIMSKPGFNLAAPGQEGGYFVSENPVVPRIALQAIEQIRTFDEQFPDYGLLTGETPAVDLELVQIVDGLTDFSDANLGARGILKRSFDAVKIPIQNVLFGRSAATFEEAYKVKATVQALNNYAEQAYLSLPGRQTQAQVDAFKATLPVVDSIVMSPGQVASTAFRTADQFKNKASLAQKELAAIEPSPGNTRKRANLQKQIAEITYMEDAYRTLGNLLSNKPPRGDETIGTDNVYESIFE
tara:strand:+ start:1911 stop:4253 length:2343 start_codon:yes stop_codon:yes gene_type:complete